MKNVARMGVREKEQSNEIRRDQFVSTKSRFGRGLSTPLTNERGKSLALRE